MKCILAELNQYVMWKRENSANTILSTGDTVIPEVQI